MRRFNPEKELSKIRNGNKNKILYSIMALLIIISISSTYALYQVRNSKKLVYTIVKPFNNKDINIVAVLVDGKIEEEFPDKEKGKVYDRIDCDNNEDNHVKAHWDYDKWALIVETNKKAKCSVYFKTGTDTSGANAPELYQGLIPVTFEDNGTIKVADPNSEWYNYSKKQWANAVLVDASNSTIKAKYFKEDNSLRDDITGIQVPMEEVLQMYVWIPRYKYQLFNSVVGNISDERMINIRFEHGTETTGEVTCRINELGNETCENAINGNWYTHPAFTFGNTELKGIWVGKFESGGSISNVEILPDIVPILNQTLSSLFNASRKIEEENALKYNLNKTEIDTHMMKNMEWGAMAYLTQSKYGRCEVNGNCVEVTKNAQGNKTGCDDSNNSWNTENGMRASTTGNMYGIYDTSGGAWDEVMGNMVNQSGDFNPSAAGGNFYINEKKQNSSNLDEKYYDKYEYGSNYFDYKRGHLGDATRETLTTLGIRRGSWFKAELYLPYSTESWFIRGARAGSDAFPGIFASWYHDGRVHSTVTFRVVLTVQDGTD